MASQDNFKALQDKVQSALVTTVKGANRVASEDLSFQRTVNPSVSDELDDKTERMLALTSKILNAAAEACGQDKVEDLEDADDVDMRWRKIVDVVDSVLEKADRSMDEFTGVLKRKDAPTETSTQTTKKPKTMLANNMRNANMSKPQLEFERKVDNQKSWEPLLTTKPHATVPLDKSLTGPSSVTGATENKHPYETEILQARYPQRVYEQAEPILYHPVDSTSPTWVDTYEGVLEMLKELKKAKEIAVDLEHHETRTYVGLLSLMQISTRDRDWVVDTLKPWRHRLEILNEVFADPSIIKVFHGSHMDMIWLQRDLGLYVNGLFDTYFACEALGYPQRNLAYLLKRFADFDADKKYQMADWRIRPLPEEMLYYARSDTHYLLYVYDMVRNELINASDRTKHETDYIERVLEKSKELSLSRYDGTSYDAETGKGGRGWYNLLLKYPMPLSGQQFAVYRAIWKWRDGMARRHDESTGYILPNAAIADIARQMPPDAKALHSLIPPQSFFARKNVNDIWSAYETARAQGINEPSLFNFLQNSDTTSSAKRIPKIMNTQQATEIPDDAEVGTLSKSQLFGSVPISSKWESRKAAPKNDYVLMPWQRLVQTAAATTAAAAAAADVDMVDDEPAAETAQPAKPAKTEEEEEPDAEFTLKGGNKRKSRSNDDTSDESESDDGGAELNDTSGVVTDESSEDEDEDESGAEDTIEVLSEDEVAAREAKARKEAKAQRKAEKRAEKKKAKQEAAAAGQSGEEPQRPAKSRGSQEVEFGETDKAERKRKRQEKKERKAAKEAKKAAKAAAAAAEKEAQGPAQPFDYSKASSVLHTSRKGGDQQGQKKFDPYSKTGDDGPKGARKAPPLHGSRSATFKK